MPTPDGNAEAAGCWRAAVRLLGDAGVRDLFGLPGDDLAVLDAAAESDVRFTLCRDQRNAAFMACGYAIQSGRLAVAVVGKGPAVTNALTGVLEAAGSSAPVLLLSGGTSARSRGSGGFQELDQLPVLAPLVKWAARVDHPARVAPMLRRAVLTARSGAPGPVYLELPDHLLDEPIPLPAHGFPEVEAPQRAGGSAGAEVVRRAERPIVVVGGGMRHRNADRAVERFAAEFGAAMSCTASGRGSVDEDHPAFVGLSGLYAPEPAAALWDAADCVIALGTRLEETAVDHWPERIGTAVPVVQVNARETDLAPEYGGPLIVGDALDVLRGWLDRGPAGSRGKWGDRVRAVHEELRDQHRRRLERLRAAPGLHIEEVLSAIDEVVPRNRVLVQENGLQDMWSYRYPAYSCGADGGSVVPCEQTSLGFGAAAAVGVKLAAPERPVVAFVGDGAFRMVDADLLTAVQAGGVLYVVLRNGGYGWLQSQLGQDRPAARRFSFLDGEDLRIPEHPRLHHRVVPDGSALEPVLAEAWRQCADGGVVVLEVPVRLQDALFDAAGDFPVAPENG